MMFTPLLHHSLYREEHEKEKNIDRSNEGTHIRNIIVGISPYEEYPLYSQRLINECNIT
jgi:hypothetical protein